MDTLVDSPPMSQHSLKWPSGLGRAWLIFTGTVAPGFSAWLAYCVSAPHWQSERLSDYAALVLGNSAIVFAPFLLYASGCLVGALFAPSRWLPYFAVRFGVYSGVVLSIHLLLLWLGAIAGQSGPDVGMLWFLLALGLSAPFWLRVARSFLARRSEAFRFNALMVSVTAIFPLAVVAGSFDAPGLIGAPLATAFFSLPAFCLLAYLRATRLVYRGYGGRGQFSLGEVFWFTTWSGAYTAAWRLSVTYALEEYAKLPKSPPRCYVCTAAARGHRRFVGSRSVPLADGRTVLVNMQMRRFKVAEIALRAVLPRCHAALRGVYDRLGPPAADCLENPVMADLAYLALKPIEVVVSAVMRRTFPEFDAAANRVY